MTPRSGASRRRRFSLPPLDDDHEKVNRSIESFLSSGEPADDPSARRAGEAIAGSARAADRAARDASKGRAADGGRPPTTVALVAVAAARPDASASDSAPDAPPAGAIPPDSSPRADAAAAGASESETAAIAAVERSLRAAARGTDHVESVAHGRFRVVLAATGELAARAYLRRVRATVEPLLEELDPPRRLAVATATILGEPIDRAYEMVERRLDAVVNRARGDDDPARPGDDAASASIGPRPAPRASGDD
ncbi:MAG TPA: hypothetical protein VFP22_10440 [Candidatus Limnocylindrales bacterium]|nr:hypothetical protein [Candidatus Limnocylindrales bacterium]